MIEIAELAKYHQGRKVYMEKGKFEEAKKMIDDMEALADIISVCKDSNRKSLTISGKKFQLLKQIIAKFGEDDLETRMKAFKKL